MIRDRHLAGRLGLRLSRASIRFWVFLAWAGLAGGAERTVDFGGIVLKFPEPEGMTEIVTVAGKPPASPDSGKRHRSAHSLAYFHNDMLPAFAILSKDDGLDHRFVTPEMCRQRADEIAADTPPTADPATLEPGKGQYLPAIVRDENLILVPSFVRKMGAAGSKGRPDQLLVWIHAYARIKNRLVLISVFAPFVDASTQAGLLRRTEDYVAAVRKLNGSD
jgi:hypothetical protein